MFGKSCVRNQPCSCFLVVKLSILLPYSLPWQSVVVTANELVQNRTGNLVILNPVQNNAAIGLMLELAGNVLLSAARDPSADYQQIS